AFVALVAFDVTRGQRARREAVPLRFAPPAGPWEGKAPQHGLLFIKHNDRATAGAGLQGRKCGMGAGKRCRVRHAPARGAAVAHLLLLQRSAKKLEFGILTYESVC